ncbi:MAG: sugar porter family MFS transporter [Deltaproteobacteria bacterium]|nr:sugar porter family MFS transporter [Deltaproteobacteria bacterium]
MTISATAGLLFGFDTGNIAGALIYIEKTFHTSTLQNQVIVSSTVQGAFFGAITSGHFVRHFGCKLMLTLAGLLFMIGAMGGSLAQSVNELIICRALLGVAIGISSFSAPLYISELAPAAHRGRLVLLNGVAITSGEALAFLLDYFLSSGDHWRIMILIGVAPALVLLIGMFFMPESPRWLVSKHRIRDAEKVLTKIREEDILPELQQIISAVNRPKIFFTSFLISKKYRKPIIIAVMLAIFQQFFGINTIMYYGPYLFKYAGFQSDSSQILATFFIGMINLVMTVVTLRYVDSWGRRNFLMTGSLLSAISLLALVLIPDYWMGSVPFLVLGIMSLYIAGYCISVGSLFWLIISEIFPAHFRPMAMSLATAIHWMANFAVSMSFLSMLESMGPQKTFGCYAVICFLSFLFAYFIVPETKGKTLEAIEDDLYNPVVTS